MKKSILFSNISYGESCYDVTDKATYKGVTIKTSIYLLITTVVAVVFGIFLPRMIENNPTLLYSTLVGAMVIGFISAIVGRLSYSAAKYAGTVYSIAEGVVLGTISAIVEMVYPGIAIIAVFSTVIIFGVMLSLFATGIIRGGNVFRAVVFGILIGILALSLFTLIMAIFNETVINNLGFCILFEVFFLIYGAITLTFNFLEARMIVEGGADKKAEWGVALGLEVSLIYIYVEVLRLLILIMDRR